jgi:hypothetical protein
MPAQYEAIKASYLARGKSKSLAEKLAAMTYNAHRGRGVAPVTRNSDLQNRLMRKK